MDQADPAPLQSALSDQVTLLDQHQRHPPQPVQTPRDPLSSQPVSVLCLLSRSTVGEDHVPDPEPGDLGRCRSFLLQCSLVFVNAYATDKARVTYIVRLLKGGALAWATAVWDRQLALWFSLSAFTAKVRKVFDHLVKGKEAAKCLLSLHQGPCSAGLAEYLVEFLVLAA